MNWPTELCAVRQTAWLSAEQLPSSIRRRWSEARESVSANPRQRAVTFSLTAHTFTAKKRYFHRDLRGLGCAFQRDDREVPPATDEVDLECESITGLSGDERARSGAGRAARPASAWLKAWTSIRWS